MEKNTIRKILIRFFCLHIILLSQVPQGLGHQGVATDENYVRVLSLLPRVIAYQPQLHKSATFQHQNYTNYCRCVR